MTFIQVPVLVLLIALLFYYIPKIPEPKLLPIVEGFFQPEFMEVALVFRRNMESGKEQGASFAVYHDGDIVVDMWAGYADRDSMRRWRNETTTLAFGCTKGVMAFLVAIMVERGLLNYSKPVADYWQDFGVNGKGEITLEMLLNHQAGLPYLKEAISLRDLESDIQHVDKSIFSQSPVWKPGTLHGYHEWTFGIILDRLIQKQDPKHRTVSEIFQEEIAKPLDVEFDMHLKSGDVHKTARIYQPPVLQSILQAGTNLPYLKMYIKSFFSSDSLVSKVWNSVKESVLPVLVFNDPEIREISLSSYSGTGTSRGLAKLFSVLANSGLYEGNRILRRETTDKMKELANGDTCFITGLPKKFSLGMQVFTNPYGETTFCHAGYGGQMVVADPSNKLSIAYLTSYLSIYRNGDDPRFLDLQRAVYSNLQKYIERRKKMTEV
ncbi:beta-lactamase domain-containing protein 2-like [Mercenaria mercenaria]|uniref:beta-lactamase domain-containing protein 2-like n=1 Tax=Mercenaria mercenaria TaxID=6596 RepID=UPI00234F252B|nr:beta-lactamase domain-containing protein 2-like [Mercenaria mercenaria]